ncbi:hypothetical protein [Alloscardovia criceti]|uniref:hypothetical protein n=1 Tax=Alloscardovia criceti TaxID=356828 RepID=UPI00037338A9|nr:hypothetical protein [Alloscardovia criceti]
MKKWTPLYAILAICVTFALQCVALSNSVHADLFYMSIGAAFFTLPLSVYLVSPSAKKWMLWSAFFTMTFVGMRFDAEPALIVAGILMFAFSALAVAGEIRVLVKK